MLSSTYVYYREVNLDDDVLNISTIDGKNASMGDKVLDHLDEKFIIPTVSSKSEPNLTEIRNNASQNGGLWKSRSNNSLNYDGDTDSIHGDIDGINYEEIKLKCTICDIEYNAYLEFPSSTGGKDSHDGIGKRFRKHRRRKRQGLNNSDDDESNHQKVNFEDYKDWAHRMEEFDPRAERKWTLEYEVDSELPRLAKIIIGRGHENEFPELNNIHLFDNVKSYRKSLWRNSMLNQLKNFNSNIKDKYALIPTNQTCLFCFTERQQEIKQVSEQGHIFTSNFDDLKKNCTHDKIVGDYRDKMCHSGVETAKASRGDNDDYRKRNNSAPAEPIQRTKSKFNKNKFKINVFKGKSITRIMRSTKQEKTEQQQNVGEEEEDEEFEVI